MNKKKAKRKASDVRNIGIEQMSEHAPDKKALDKFKRKPYQAAKLLREQGQQIIREGVSAGGQRNPD